MGHPPMGHPPVGNDVRAVWNRRYREESRDREPSPFLVWAEPFLPRRGAALDVAGGNGRNAVWLAGRGLDVTVVDIADDGLALATALAEEHAVPLATETADLEADSLPPGPWDLIVCFHYLQRSIFPRFAAGLREGGLLIAEIATRRNLERHHRPPAHYLLEEGEATHLLTPLVTLHYTEGWNESGRHEARMIARKPPG